MSAMSGFKYYAVDMSTYVPPVSPSSIIWYQLQGSDGLWLGRSGITLAMHVRYKWLIHLQDQGLSKEDEHWSSCLWCMALLTSDTTTTITTSSRKVKTRKVKPIWIYCSKR